jgi:hypothetical protein
MRRPLAGLLLLAAAIVPLAPAPAAAQVSSAQQVGPRFTAVEAARFSKQVEQDLAARGARVAIVFRTGRPRDALPEGIDYTHGAFWVHRTVSTQGGGSQGGYAVYNLYAGGPDGAWPKNESRLVQDWPLDFVRGSAVDDLAVIVPTPELQRRLLSVIDSPTYERLHNPAYTLVANPFEGRYQNCTTFMLEVIAAALWQTDDPARLSTNLRASFKPSVIPANGLTRFFGPMVDARLRTDDHKGAVRTATYESVAEFLGGNGLLEAAYVTRPL